MRVIQIAVQNKDIQLKLSVNAYSLIQLISTSGSMYTTLKIDDKESGIKIEIPLDQIEWLQNTKLPE